MRRQNAHMLIICVGFYSVEKLEIQEKEKIPKPLAYFCPNNALSNGCFGRKNRIKTHTDAIL
jgi:hypothetical protein